jgi:hypothetical protein
MRGSLAILRNKQPAGHHDIEQTIVSAISWLFIASNQIFFQ